MRQDSKQGNQQLESQSFWDQPAYQAENYNYGRGLFNPLNTRSAVADSYKKKPMQTSLIMAAWIVGLIALMTIIMPFILPVAGLILTSVTPILGAPAAAACLGAAGLAAVYTVAISPKLALDTVQFVQDTAKAGVRNFGNAVSGAMTSTQVSVEKKKSPQQVTQDIKRQAKEFSQESAKQSGEIKTYLREIEKQMRSHTDNPAQIKGLLNAAFKDRDLDNMTPKDLASLYVKFAKLEAVAAVKYPGNVELDKMFGNLNAKFEVAYEGLEDKGAFAEYAKEKLGRTTSASGTNYIADDMLNMVRDGKAVNDVKEHQYRYNSALSNLEERVNSMVNPGEEIQPEDLIQLGGKTDYSDVKKGFYSNAVENMFGGKAEGLDGVEISNDDNVRSTSATANGPDTRQNQL